MGIKTMTSVGIGPSAPAASQTQIAPSAQMDEAERSAAFKEAAANARRAAQERDWQTAARWWREAIASSPDHAPAYVGAGAALRSAGSVDEAEELLSLAMERFPDNEAVALGHAHTANAARHWPVALERWTHFCARFPNSIAGVRGRLSALRGADRVDEAAGLLNQAGEALAAARLRGEDTIEVRWLALEIAREANEPAAIRPAAQALIEAVRDPGQLVRIAQACANAREFELADRAASMALAVDPRNTGALVARAAAATEHGEGEAALAFYAELIALNPDAVRWRLMRFRLLNWMGRTADAAEEFASLYQRWPNEPMVRVFRRTYLAEGQLVLGQLRGDANASEADLDTAAEQDLRTLAERAPPEVQRVRPLVAPQPNEDVIEVICPVAKTAVLIFTGFNDAVSIPLATFDRYLATIPVAAIYLKDFNRLRYLGGVRSLAVDIAGTLRSLSDMVSRLQVDRLVTMGNCVGGFAAIRYGVELGADRIIAFDALTHIGRDSEIGVERGYNFLRKRLAANVPAELTDLRLFLEQRQYRNQIDLFYLADSSEYRENAERLSKFQNVQLHPISSKLPHNGLRQFALSQIDFGATLRDLLDS